MWPTHWPSPFATCTPRARCGGNMQPQVESTFKSPRQLVRPNRIESLLSMRLRFAFAILLLVLPVSAQQEAASAVQPSVTFRFDWSQGIPWQTYSIAVQADGNTHFQGTPAPDGPGGDTDPFQQDFTMSEANRSKIFD